MNIQGSSKPICIRIQSVKIDDVSPEEVKVNEVFHMLNRIGEFCKEASLGEFFMMVVVFCYQVQFTLDQFR